MLGQLPPDHLDLVPDALNEAALVAIFGEKLVLLKLQLYEASPKVLHRLIVQIQRDGLGCRDQLTAKLEDSALYFGFVDQAPIQFGAKVSLLSEEYVLLLVKDSEVVLIPEGLQFFFGQFRLVFQD